MSMKLIESTHTYVNELKPHMQYISCTTLIGKYHEEFDLELHSAQVAERRGMTQDEVKNEWAEINRIANEFGTAFHKTMEDYLLSNRMYVPKNNQEEKMISSFESLGICKSRSSVVKPEYIMSHEYDDEVGLAGTSDVIEDVDFWGDGSWNDLRFNVWDFKGLSLDTEIPTKDGFKLMRNIKVGDTIFDGNGDLTKVQHISEIHHNPTFKITLDTNDEIICDHEHKWVISRRSYKDRYFDEEKTTEELFEMKQSGQPIRIECVGINLPDADLPVDPYVLGLWLGDGSKSCGLLTNMNQKVWDEIERRGYKLGDDVSQGGSGKAQGRTIYGLYTELNKLNLIGNKHIPDIYMRSSYNQRLDLLRGFMDTDGYYNAKRDRCVMITTQKWQANALSELVSSLGWKPTTINAKTDGFGKKGVKTFHVTFKPIDVNPFLNKTEDYLNICGKNTIKSKYRYVKKIEKIETVPTKCLSVTSPTHTYLATRNYIKTHNTNKKFKYENPYQNAWMRFPVAHLTDTHLNHYTLQMSIYALMYERETGRRCNRMGLLYWNRTTEEFELINVPYMKLEAQALIDHFGSAHLLTFKDELKNKGITFDAPSDDPMIKLKQTFIDL